MAFYKGLETDDLDWFNNFLGDICADNTAKVVASNAYFNGKHTMYYALIEYYDEVEDDPTNRIINHLDQIKRNTDRIE